MASEKQIQANRLNALKSTGPKSPAGNTSITLENLGKRRRISPRMARITRIREEGIGFGNQNPSYPCYP